MRPPTTVFFFVATLLGIAHAARLPQWIRPLRWRSGAADGGEEVISCLSWRLAVETNNLRDWDVVPEACGSYIADYMLGDQYPEDCSTATAAALEYAQSLNLTGDGKDVWVFDMDDTALSNLPYYNRSTVAFGTLTFNETAFDEWLLEGVMPPVPAVLQLYNQLISLGIKTVFISGSSESYEEVRISNLNLAGYYGWEKLILRPTSESGTAASVYKSKKRGELIEAGYRIVGNMGDQWSDLLGNFTGDRTFKVPNPMYYI